MDLGVYMEMIMEHSMKKILFVKMRLEEKCQEFLDNVFGREFGQGLVEYQVCIDVMEL